jgi:glucokinase
MTGQSAKRSYYLGIDVGGTNVKAGVVDDHGHPQSHCSRPTQAARGPHHGVETICHTAQDAIAASEIDVAAIRAIGLATPGTMDIPAGVLLDPPNLPGWTNLPIRQLVADRFEKPTVLQNDANAAAFGEYWAGAGRTAHSLVMITLGTGVGGGIIVGNTIIQGEHSHGSECGHIIVQMENGRRCVSGQYGTLEAYVSATALVERCVEQLPDNLDSAVHQHMAGQEKPTALLIAEVAASGDPFALDLVMETARYLGIGITSLMHTINPNMFLIGGAMTFGRDESALGRQFLERVREEVRERAFPVPYHNTPIVFASLGGDAGFIGAAGCAKLEHQQKESG